MKQFFGHHVYHQLKPGGVPLLNGIIRQVRGPLWMLVKRHGLPGAIGSTNVTGGMVEWVANNVCQSSRLVEDHNV